MSPFISSKFWSKLGTEKSYKYQLISYLGGQWDLSCDIAEETKQSAVAVEIRSALAHTKSPVQYIVHLGCLQCVATYTHGTRSTGSSKPWNTPFAIVLNIVDKSLWMVLGKFRMDINEPDEPIEETDNNWDFLPESANGRPSFDVMQILTWKDFIELEKTSAKGRRFFSKEALATARRIVPEFYAAAESDVKKALAFRKRVHSRSQERKVTSGRSIRGPNGGEQRKKIA